MKPATPKAKPAAVVLDFGGVLVEIHGRNVVEALCVGASPASRRALDGVSSWHAHHDYERGSMDTAQFSRAVSERMQHPLTEPDFVVAWNKIFGPVVAGIDVVLAEIGQAVPLYLLSNTNAAHWQHIIANFGFMRHFQHMFTSFDLGTRKPEPAIYTKVAEQIGVPAGQLLFVDDLPENVEAARAVGFKSEVCLNSSARLRQIMLDYSVLT